MTCQINANQAHQRGRNRQPTFETNHYETEFHSINYRRIHWIIIIIKAALLFLSLIFAFHSCFNHVTCSINSKAKIYTGSHFDFEKNIYWKNIISIWQGMIMQWRIMVQKQISYVFGQDLSGNGSILNIGFWCCLGIWGTHHVTEYYSQTENVYKFIAIRLSRLVSYWPSRWKIQHFNGTVATQLPLPVLPGNYVLWSP